MALESSRHLITAQFLTKGWSLYKTTVNKSGKIVSRVYKQQVTEGNKVAKMTKTVTGNTAKMSTTFTKATGKTNDLMKALRRAAIVAPVWLALRSVMMKTIRTISEGSKAWEAWDKALIKSKAVIHTTSMSISNAYIRLQDEVEQLSLKTGVSLDKVTNAFFRFGTLGIEFEDSLAGMTASMNIALTMGGDLEQVARPLAFAYKLLGDTMDQSIPVHERMEVLGSKMFAIWKINAFEINEFSQSLNNFLPTANTANFTIDETVTLLTALSSSAILGARGGRLLRQSVLRLVGNLDSLASQLGLAVNPQMESTNDILLKVLKRIKDLGEAGTTRKAAKALSEIFGGARMGEAARGLISVFDLIQENTSIMTASGEELDKLLKKQADRLDEVTNSLHKQMEIGRNLTTQLGRVFLKGIFGGEQYAETIKNINKAKTNMLPIIETMGSTIKNMFLGAHTSGDFYLEMLKKIRKEKEIITPAEERKAIRQDVELVYRDIETGEAFETYEALEAFTKKEEKNIKRINYENQIKLNLLQEVLEISKLEAMGLSKSQKIYKSLTAEVKERVKQFNELADLEKLGFEKVEKKQILLLLEGKEYEKILELTGEQIFNQDKLYEIAKKQSDFEAARFKEKQSAIKLLVTHEANLAKLRGATSRQTIETTIEMNRQLGIGQDALSLLKNQLALEIAIKKEKEAQTKLSSDTMKLYEIAQKEGITAAKQIGDFLEGRMTYQVLQTREVFGVFKEYFPQIEKTMQALKYFKRGVGRGIPIAEEAVRTPKAVSRLQATRAAERIKELPQVPITAKADINTIIKGIEIKLPEGSLSDLAEETGKQVIDKLKSDEKLQKFLAQILRPYL